jgi:hypothetical protein
MKFVEKMMKHARTKQEARDRLFNNCDVIDCHNEHAFISCCNAMFAAGIPKLLDCGIEVYWQGKDDVICIKWYKDEA